MPRGIPKYKDTVEDKERLFKDLKEISPKHQPAIRGQMAATLRKIVIQNPQRLHNVADRLLALAEEGDMPAIKEVFDRLDGRSVQSTEISGPEGSAIKVDFAGDLARALATDILNLRQKKNS
jgi:hypothetical protein